MNLQLNIDYTILAGEIPSLIQMLTPEERKEVIVLLLTEWFTARPSSESYRAIENELIERYKRDKIFISTYKGRRYAQDCEDKDIIESREAKEELKRILSPREEFLKLLHQECLTYFKTDIVPQYAADPVILSSIEEVGSKIKDEFPDTFLNLVQRNFAGYLANVLQQGSWEMKKRDLNYPILQ